jgi:hypothetical protein
MVASTIGTIVEVCASEPCNGLRTVPDRTLGGVYLLSAMIMQWYVIVILLKFLIALGVVFIGLWSSYS